MPITMSKELLRPEGGTRQEKFQVMQDRRKVLTRVAKQVLESAGYVPGQSLKIPGAHSFEAKFKGGTVKVGIKTSADRWVSIPRDGSGGFGLLSGVDEVFIVTFDEWPGARKVQIYRFDPKLITDRAIRVYEDADRRGHTGLQFLPLDDLSDRRTTTVHRSNLKELGELFFEDEIEWTEGPPSPPSPAKAVATPAGHEPSEAPILDRIKAMLADHLGVRPELIDIEVRVKV
jgi:hypothetical protein